MWLFFTAEPSMYLVILPFLNNILLFIELLVALFFHIVYFSLNHMGIFLEICRKALYPWQYHHTSHLSCWCFFISCSPLRGCFWLVCYPPGLWHDCCPPSHPSIILTWFWLPPHVSPCFFSPCLSHYRFNPSVCWSIYSDPLPRKGA